MAGRVAAILHRSYAFYCWLYLLYPSSTEYYHTGTFCVYSSTGTVHYILYCTVNTVVQYRYSSMSLLYKSTMITNIL